MSDPALDHLRLAIKLFRQTPGREDAAVAAEVVLAMAAPGEAIGNVLRKARQATGLKIGELARLAKLSVNTLKNIEANRTTPAPGSLARLVAVPALKLAVAEHILPALDAHELRPNSHLTARYDPAGLAHDLRAIVNGPGGTVEQSHLYLDSQSAADYLAVCEAYGGVRGRLFAALVELAAQIQQELPRLDVIAIGSGDGRAEVCLAQALGQLGCLRKLYLLDISHVLLTRANEHAVAVMGPLDIDVETVHGNFHELVRYSMLHKGPGKPQRVYTLLGSTMANLLDELRFFRDLASCASPGDLVVVDYQIAHEPPENDPSLAGGSVPKILYDWHAGPLRRNNAAVREVHIALELGPGRVPGSYVVVVVGKAAMADGSTRNYRLGGSSRYQPDLLSAALAGAGWATVVSRAYDQRTAVALLRRL